MPSEGVSSRAPTLWTARPQQLRTVEALRNCTLLPTVPAESADHLWVRSPTVLSSAVRGVVVYYHMMGIASFHPVPLQTTGSYRTEEASCSSWDPQDKLWQVQLLFPAVGHYQVKTVHRSDKFAYPQQLPFRARTH